MRSRNVLPGAALAAGLLALGGGRARAHDDLPPAIAQAGPAAPARAPGPFQLSLGVRSALFRSAGYDPFSTNDVFVQTGVMATWALRTSAALATAVGATWEAGTADASARGAETELSLRRLGVVVEERYAPRPWLYAFARVSPSWLRGTATLRDLSVAAPLSTTFDTLAVDGSAGAAACIPPRTHRITFCAVADGGYGWAPAQRLALAPALPAPDRDKAGVTTLADLAPRGAFYRLALALTF
ncbi:MAG TPA: hypothetical protein VHL80_08935 [Polyangia bacterium]|nr:hypothetical protein [Polyangia bacterium]